ncbi:hypothetical protein D9M68_248320 [compost metagenome]
MQEFAGVDRDALGLGDGVSQVRGGAGEAEGAIADDAAGLAVERIGRNIQVAVARVLDGAFAVVQGGGGHLHVTACGERALGAVVEQPVDGHVQAGLAGGQDRAALVEQFARLHRGVAGRRQGAAGVVEALGYIYATRRGARSGDAAALVAEGLGAQVQPAIAGDDASSVVHPLAGTHNE